MLAKRSKSKSTQPGKVVEILDIVKILTSEDLETTLEKSVSCKDGEDSFRKNMGAIDKIMPIAIEILRNVSFFIYGKFDLISVGSPKIQMRVANTHSRKLGII